MITFNTAKALKKNGWPQQFNREEMYNEKGEFIKLTPAVLEHYGDMKKIEDKCFEVPYFELLEMAIGKRLMGVMICHKDERFWEARERVRKQGDKACLTRGASCTDALANLWIAIKNKPKLIKQIEDEKKLDEEVKKAREDKKKQ